MGGIQCKCRKRSRSHEANEGDHYLDLYSKKKERFYMGCIPWPQTRHKLHFYCAYLLTTFFAGALGLTFFVLLFYYAYFLTWVENSSKQRAPP